MDHSILFFLLLYYGPDRGRMLSGRWGLFVSSVICYLLVMDGWMDGWIGWIDVEGKINDASQVRPSSEKNVEDWLILFFDFVQYVQYHIILPPIHLFIHSTDRQELLLLLLLSIILFLLFLLLFCFCFCTIVEKGAGSSAFFGTVQIITDLSGGKEDVVMVCMYERQAVSFKYIQVSNSKSFEKFRIRIGWISPYPPPKEYGRRHSHVTGRQASS